ncbi:MAG: LEA type 2 family protein [Prevotellaceae bacterium]|jgi:LEA14-like dessication related protein|nr:LEA type 2 family protein [Prevotellaceae bacterium]
MKVTKLKIIIILFMIGTTFMSCDVLSGALSFVNCKYEFAGFSNPSVAGINISNVTNINNINAASLLKLTAGILSGSLPLSFTANISATNPNTTAAQIAGLDWGIDLNSTNVLSGTLDHSVSIPGNGGKTIIPLTIQTDLLQLFKGESRENIMSFINHLLNTGEGSSNVAIRIRPAIMVGGQKIQTGFITLSKNLK